MSVWVLQVSFTGEQEQQLEKNTMLPLPFDGLPDLSGIRSEEDMRRLLLSVQPELAPETVMRRAEIYWRNFSRLVAEDLLVVPLSNRNCNALAEVVVPYHYTVEEDRDVHHVEVRWLDENIPHRKLTFLRKLLDNATTMQPLENMDDRKQVYLLLKRSYNRFSNWRWLLVAVFVIAELGYALQMIHHYL